jgi:hypothetical protein
MNISDTTLEIRTLGGFSISVAGKPVAADWPDKSIKLFFCSLLSPLDASFTWERICNSKWGVPATRISRSQLEDTIIQPLISFLVKELGFNPLITGHEGIRIDLLRIHVDALEFHNTVVEGLRLLYLGNHVAALKKMTRAASLYAGSYLPGMLGKIITDTRNDLMSLYRTAVLDAMPLARNPGCSVRNRRAEPGMYLMAA